ncbi:hybrid sensor histidine kinase/response regulator [Desulfoplanes sp. PS50]
MSNTLKDLEKLMGLGERSTRKSYYPELQAKIRELERFNMILNRSHDIVIMALCEGGRIVDCNRTACRTLGYRRRELIGQSVDRVFSSLVMEMARTMSDPNGVRFADVNGELVSVSGEIIPVEVSLQRILYDETCYLVFVTRDISKRVQVQKDKHRLEQQLLQSQRMETIGTFAGGIAHDFNNLLQIISGNIQMLGMKNKDEGLKRHVQAIDQTTLKASNLVRRLLTISRKVESSKRRLCLNDIIRDTMALSERLIPRMIAMDIHLEPDLPPIMADSVQMEQIILNLSSNAFDALAGKGKISVSTRRIHLLPADADKYLDLSPGDYVQFAFSDTGPGISEEIKSKIFDPFFTTKAVGKGTGLGLSTVYAIVKEHGGHISCYSTLGQGTTFKIYLPVAPDGGRSGNHARPIAAERETTGFAETTVLVIDDEEMIAELTREVLESLGCTVITAASGEQGVQIFEQRHTEIDLVLLDLGMPGMGGELCLQRLRELKPDGRFVVASGYLGHDIARKPEQYGAAAFLEKPFQSTELVATIRKVLSA